MNRETKRLLQRQGQIDQDGQPLAQKAAPAQRTRQEGGRRTSPKQYFNEVKGELKKVDWASKKEVRNYSAVVLVTLTFAVTLIFLLNVLFSRLVIFLFK